MEQEHDSEYLLAILKPITSFPDDIKVTRTIDERGVFLTVNVNPEDMGKVIGKEGTTARAIRCLLRNYGMQNQRRIAMRINEPEGGRPVSGEPTDNELAL